MLYDTDINGFIAMMLTLYAADIVIIAMRLMLYDTDINSFIAIILILYDTDIIGITATILILHDH